MGMSLIIVIGMLACASGQYQKSVYIGTPCECNASALYYTHIYDLDTSPHDNAGGCEGESEDPLDVWNGLGVEFYGNALESGVHKVFDYFVECAIPCFITRVDIAGNGWCENEDDGTTGTQIRLEGQKLEGNGDVALQAWINGYLYGTTPDLGWGESSTYGVVSLILETSDYGYGGGPSPKQQFIITEQCPDSSAQRPDAAFEWKCRNSLSIVGTTSPDEAGESSILSRKPRVESSSVDNGGVDSSESSDDSSDDSIDQPTHCHNDEECEDGQICDDLECVKSRDSSSTDSGKDSSDSSGDDSSEQPTHCHHDDECEDGQVCDVFECVDSSVDSSDESSVDSSDQSAHCHSDEECQDGQICDGFECVESSEDSSEDSSANSGDDSSDSSGDDSSDDSSDGSGLVGCEALPIDAVLSKCSANIACEARVQELEALQVTFRAMTAAKQVQSGKDVDDVAPLSPSSTSTLGDFGVEEALIVCLALLNVALLSYVCLRKSNVAKNNSAYGDVRSSEQEDLCA